MDPLQVQIEAQNALANEQFLQNLALGWASLGHQIESSDRNYQLTLQQIAEEKYRQGQIRNAVSGINQAFRGRQKVYDQLEDASFGLNKEKLDDQQIDARRALRFALARSGLSGGSVDVDQGQEINDRYNDGLIEARDYAQSVGANARAQDEALKNSLLNTALSGGASGASLLSSASQSMNSIANQAPSLAPQFAGDQYFTGLTQVGPIAAALATSGQPQFQRKQGVTVSSPGNTYTGAVT